MGQKQDQSPGAEGRDGTAGRADGADDRRGGRPAPEGSRSTREEGILCPAALQG